MIQSLIIKIVGAMFNLLVVAVLYNCIVQSQGWESIKSNDTETCLTSYFLLCCLLAAFLLMNQSKRLSGYYNFLSCPSQTESCYHVMCIWPSTDHIMKWGLRELNVKRDLKIGLLIW